MARRKRSCIESRWSVFVYIQELWECAIVNKTLCEAGSLTSELVDGWDDVMDHVPCRGECWRPGHEGGA
jgi:hypothetical protein